MSGAGAARYKCTQPGIVTPSGIRWKLDWITVGGYSRENCKSPGRRAKGFGLRGQGKRFLRGFRRANSYFSLFGRPYLVRRSRHFRNFSGFSGRNEFSDRPFGHDLQGGVHCFHVCGIHADTLNSHSAGAGSPRPQASDKELRKPIWG